MHERLENYILKDKIYQDYKKNELKDASDFDKFCIQHCEDIELLLEENQRYKEVIDKAIECIRNFLCTEEYINVNGIAIADNYIEVLDILKEA